MHEKDVVGIVTFDLIGLLPTNHIIAYITMAYRRFLRKSLMLTAKTMQIFEILLSESQVYKKWQTSAIFLEISDSNLESGRCGPKSGVSRIRELTTLLLFKTLKYGREFCSCCELF